MENGSGRMEWMGTALHAALHLQGRDRGADQAKWLLVLLCLLCSKSRCTAQPEAAGGVPEEYTVPSNGRNKGGGPVETDGGWPSTCQPVH